jgi:hypothetical protein
VVRTRRANSSCQVSHVGLVLQGRAMVRMDDGGELKLEPGDAFAIPPGHDSWVLGKEAYVSLHFLGARKLRQVILPDGPPKRVTSRQRQMSSARQSTVTILDTKEESHASS